MPLSFIENLQIIVILYKSFINDCLLLTKRSVFSGIFIKCKCVLKSVRDVQLLQRAYKCATFAHLAGYLAAVAVHSEWLVS